MGRYKCPECDDDTEFSDECDDCYAAIRWTRGRSTDVLGALGFDAFTGKAHLRDASVEVLKSFAAHSHMNPNRDKRRLKQGAKELLRRRATPPKPKPDTFQDLEALQHTLDQGDPFQ